MSTKEQIYDAEIAPILLEAAKIAQRHSIDFLACVDISSEQSPIATAETRCVDMSNSHAAMRLVQLAILAKGNVDSLVFGLAKDQRDRPHNSLVLKILESSDA